MFGLSDLKETRYYQGAVEKGKEETLQSVVLKMLAEGADLEFIARVTDLSLEEINALESDSEG